MLRVRGVKAKEKYAVSIEELSFDKGVSTKTVLKNTMMFRQKWTILA